MKYSIGLIIFFFVFFYNDGYSHQDSANWTHPYSNSTSRAWLELPPVERRIELVFDFKSVQLPEPTIQSLCGDILGIQRQMLIGLPKSRTNLIQIHFDQGTAENLLPDQPPGRLLQLSHLTDFDWDGALDVVYSATQEAEAPQILIYSPSTKKNNFSNAEFGSNRAFFCIHHRGCGF